MTDAAPQAETNNGRLPFKIEALIVIIATPLLFFAEYFVDRTEFGEEQNRVMYRFVQENLEGADREDRIPVAVVDISDMPPQVRIEENQQISITSRARLEELIQKAAEAGATGIGVDIDFSPHNNHPLQAQDEAFFKFCQKVIGPTNQPVPVRLGVFRTQVDPAESWLGSLAYSNLAASIAIPNAMAVPRRLPFWLGPPESSAHLPGLSAAFSTSAPDLSLRWFPWAWEIAQVKHLDNKTDAAEYMVNLNWLKKLKKDPTPTSQQFLTEGYDARHALCRDRILLLGDTSNSSDTFSVPGDEEVQGVFMHACGVATLFHGQLLREMTFRGQFVFAYILALVILIIIKSTECAFKRFFGYLPQRDTVEKWVVRIVIAVLWLLGYVLVARIRWVWNSFIIGLGMLLLVDPGVNKPIYSFFEKRLPRSATNPSTQAGGETSKPRDGGQH